MFLVRETFVAPHNSTITHSHPHYALTSTFHEPFKLLYVFDIDELMNRGHEGYLIAMGTGSRDEILIPLVIRKEDEFKSLEQDYRRLQEKTQELISERTHIESELRAVKKQPGRLEEEVRHLRALRHYFQVGTLQDVLDPERAIVRGVQYRTVLSSRFL